MKPWKAMNSGVTRSARPSPAGRRRLFGLLGDRRGATAIEVALILPIFVTLMFGTLEVGLLFFTATVMEGAVSEAGRLIRTGQAQRETSPLATFNAQLCEQLAGIINCDDIQYDVRTFSSFGVITLTPDLDEDGELESPVFQPGGAEEIVVIRSVYKWNFLVPFIGNLISPNGDSYYLMQATAVFRNEPYETS
ncbi:TadE/TadG family type IV pilus assembly protein [Roseospirillum parvum]|nr:TadE/TadG family type IV pilus assembly protein [Roseospirillum parvum]